MSSMLLRPIMRWPFQSTEEYRDETLTIGSPMVFHTAPPHPASRARITWSPQFAGGPDASQNGFGQRIPAKLVVRSAMGHLRDDGECGAFAVGDGVDHFAAAVHAIAAGVVSRVARTAGGTIDYDHP